ncbi:MAG TPA: HAD family hydrolase [Burkholderiaceae bacterium]|nr:HAD family hydrolase [Burkholderiaceae bacterium]
MDIALFDLDHTLIPFDSGGAFADHLAALGLLPEGFEAQYHDYCRRYASGTVDMIAMHRFTVGSVAAHGPQALAQQLRDFEEAVADRVPAAAQALVREHLDAGRLCALVTATTHFIAEPFGRMLGLREVIATQPEQDEHGHYTGEVAGDPCFREHKVAHVQAWLATHGLGWNDVTRSWFYSDSINDLPLLQAVTDPVAVDPDPALLAHAKAKGWPVLRLAALPP